MTKKTFYTSPDFRIMELKSECAICDVSTYYGNGNEGYTENEIENDYD